MLHERREMREAADAPVDGGRPREVEMRQRVGLARARRDAEVAQQALAHQVRRPVCRGADAQVHARLAEVDGAQLRVTVGEMQQADVAELRRVIQRVGSGGAPVEHEAGNRGRREHANEFPTRHRSSTS